MNSRENRAVLSKAEEGGDKTLSDTILCCYLASERSPLPTVATEGEMHIVRYANPTFCTLCCKTQEDLIGHPYAEAVQEGRENGSLALLDRVYHTGKTEMLADQEHSSHREPQSYWSYTAWAMQDAEEHPTKVVVQVTDTTEAAYHRQRLGAINQALLLSSVRQHELGATTEAKAHGLNLAVRETDHRVKNNQMIGALLDMQITTHAETVPIENLAQLRMQILMLTAVHAMLVQYVEHDPTAGILSAAKLLHKLMPMLQQVAGEQHIEWSADEVQLTSKQGSSLALLINELVTNAVKHGGEQVELRLTVVTENITIEVLDDGPGFAVGFDVKTAANFGLEFVETLSRHDLGGQTSYTNRPEGGACVRITFPAAS